MRVHVHLHEHVLFSMYVCAAPDSLPSACQEAAIVVYLCVCVCMCVGMHMHVYMGMDMHITMCKACVRASVCIYLCVRVYASAWACVRERAERAYACVCVRAPSTGTLSIQPLRGGSVCYAWPMYV